MSSINRQMLHHSLALMLGLSLIGCSSNASAPASGAPNNGVTSVPAAPQGHAAPQMGGPPAAQAGNANSGGPPGPDAMAAMMKQHGGPSSAPAGGHSGGPPSNDQMAAMMKQYGGNPAAGSNSGTMPSNDQMAAMMKQHAGSSSGSSNTGTGPSSDQMAAMMKQHGGGGAGGAGGGKHGAGGGTAPSTEQMAAMMKQYGGGAQAGGGAGGGLPGQGQIPGIPGASGGAGGTNFPPGSIDDTLFQFCTAMAEGDTAKASEYISPKAKGVLAQLRDGNLSEDKIDEITNLISPVNELQPSPTTVNNSRRALINKNQQTITFVLKKEKDDFKITELNLPKPKKR